MRLLPRVFYQVGGIRGGGDLHEIMQIACYLVGINRCYNGAESAKGSMPRATTGAVFWPAGEEAMSLGSPSNRKKGTSSGRHLLVLKRDKSDKRSRTSYRCCCRFSACRRGVGVVVISTKLSAKRVV